MQSDTALEDTLTKISEQIAKLCKKFFDETGHPITAIDVSYDNSGSIQVFTNITLSGGVALLSKKGLDS